MKNSVITVEAQRNIELMMKVSRIVKLQNAKDGSPTNKNSEDKKHADKSMIKEYPSRKKSLYNV